VEPRRRRRNGVGTRDALTALVKAGWVLGIGTVLAAAVAVYIYWGRVEEDRPAVTSAVVTRGDVVETVEATGTLRAVTTVQVGTQVSGTIKALYADFNARVRRGQVIAELEPSLFERTRSRSSAGPASCRRGR